MSAKIIDGKAIASQIREELTKEVSGLKEKNIIQSDNDNNKIDYKINYIKLNTGKRNYFISGRDGINIAWCIAIATSMSGKNRITIRRNRKAFNI